MAVKIPQAEGYEGSRCHIVFVRWSGKDGLIAAAEAPRMLAIQPGVGPGLKIHKPAIGTGGSALVFRRHYSGGEVAVKIPRLRDTQDRTASHEGHGKAALWLAKIRGESH